LYAESFLHIVMVLNGGFKSLQFTHIERPAWFLMNGFKYHRMVLNRIGPVEKGLDLKNYADTQNCVILVSRFEVSRYLWTNRDIKRFRDE